MLLGEFKEYRGFKGTIEYSSEGRYFGKVMGDSVKDREYEASNVIDLYVAFCDLIDSNIRYENFEALLVENKVRKVKLKGSKIKIK